MIGKSMEFEKNFRVLVVAAVPADARGLKTPSRMVTVHPKCPKNGAWVADYMWVA